MSAHFTERGPLNLPEIQREVLDYWKAEDVFKQSLRDGEIGRAHV